MNSNATPGPWRQFKIQLRKTWSELTDADLEAISRDSDDLVQVVQHCYDAKGIETTKRLRVDERGCRETSRVPAAHAGK